MGNSIGNIKRSKQTIFEIVVTTVIILIGLNFVVLGISIPRNCSDCDGGKKQKVNLLAKI